MKNKYSFESGDKIFFTSDTHFGHENIMKFCNRPFKDINEMNDEIIKRWNEVVPEDGIVFHLGDFAFGCSQFVSNIIDKLNGTIYLCLGNHDRKMIKQGFMNKFGDVQMQYYIQIENRKIYLNHFPFLCYDGTYRGESATWQLFGHVHSCELNKTGQDNQRLINLWPFQYDVGTDNNNFTPVSFKQVKEIITDQMLSLNMYRGGSKNGN